MGEFVKFFLLDVVLYTILVVYESYYEKITDEFEWKFSREERRSIRNVIGVMVLAFDVWFFIRMMDHSPREINKIVLMYAAGVLFVIHILASIFALFKNTKAYTVLDVIAWFVRFIPICIAFFMDMLFKMSGRNTMILLIAAMGLLVYRAIRMLDGEWMELRIEDMEDR